MSASITHFISTTRSLKGVPVKTKFQLCQFRISFQLLLHFLLEFKAKSFYLRSRITPSNLYIGGSLYSV